MHPLSLHRCAAQPLAARDAACAARYWRSGIARCMVCQHPSLHPPRAWARPL